MKDGNILQKEYYQRTAEEYDELHWNAEEHNFALHMMSSIIEYCGVKSVLDVGSGTGRAVLHVRDHHPEVAVTGIEPVEALRKQGYQRGLEESQLVGGDGTDMAYESGEFDLTCSFGVLHHIAEPREAIEEMLRVADKAVFISDSNTYGAGKKQKRLIKQLAWATGLWDLFNYILTRGRGYKYDDGDGVWYEYSIFNDVDLIRERCRQVHFINTEDSGIDLYRTAGHVAVIGIK